MTTATIPLVRGIFKREYFFLAINPEGKLVFRVTSKFTVTNPDTVERPYRSQMEFEQGDAPSPITVAIWHDNRWIETSGPCIPSTTRPRIVELTSSPITLAPSESCFVQWTYQMESDDTGKDLISFGSPAKSAEITIADLPSRFDYIVEGIPPADNVSGWTWEFSRTIEPGQCLTARWWEKEASEPNREATKKVSHTHACYVCSCRWDCIEPRCSHVGMKPMCPWCKAECLGARNLPLFSHDCNWSVGYEGDDRSKQACNLCRLYQQGVAHRLSIAN